MKIYASTGEFAGDKDAAAHIREYYLRPTLRKMQPAVLDFEGVSLATQSFVHAMIAAVIREDPDRLSAIEFQNCSDNVKAVIEIVVEYAQEQLD